MYNEEVRKEATRNNILWAGMVGDEEGEISDEEVENSEGDPSQSDKEASEVKIARKLSEYTGGNNC